VTNALDSFVFVTYRQRHCNTCRHSCDWMDR